MTETVFDTESPEPTTRARALIMRGLSRAEAGEPGGALADFQAARRIAERDGLDWLVRAACINEGYAYTLQGDTDSAIRAHEEAIELTRAAQDTERLTLALANLSVELKQQGRYADALTALDEYLDLLGEEEWTARSRGFVSRAQCCAELGELEQAAADLDLADLAAAESGDASLVFPIRMSQASTYIRMRDYVAALIVLEQALEAAESAGDRSGLVEALTSLAQVYRLTAQSENADAAFARLEDELRQNSRTSELADAFYWHGAVLESLRRFQPALDKWREEESIRRELGQDGHLAECLYAQANALRAIGEHETADPLFADAADLLTKVGVTAELANVHYWHAASLREVGRSADALSRADEALRVAIENEDAGAERRIQGLRGMLFADVGKIASAQETLDAAEALCEQTDAQSSMVWTLARRAYVAACDGASTKDVVNLLGKAHEYGMSHGQMLASRTAVRRVGLDIVGRCQGIDVEPLEVFRRKQLDEIELAMSGGMSPRLVVHADDSAEAQRASLDEGASEDTPEE